MTVNKILDYLKLNYSDFYKFVISGSIGLLIFSSITASAFLTVFSDSYNPLVRSVLVGFYIGLSSCSVISLIWAAKKWYKNQILIDNLLFLEYSKKKGEIEKLIEDIAEKREPFEIFNWYKAISRAKIREQIEK